MMVAVLVTHAMGIMQGDLDNVAVTNEMVKGEYHGSFGSIQFFSEVKDDDYKLSVTSAGRKPILLSRKPQGSNMMMMTIGNNGYLVNVSQPSSELSEYYVVSQDLHHLVESALILNTAPDTFWQTAQIFWNPLLKQLKNLL